jgi:hypothetical protein
VATLTFLVCILTVWGRHSEHAWHTTSSNLTASSPAAGQAAQVPYHLIHITLSFHLILITLSSYPYHLILIILSFFYHLILITLSLSSYSFFITLSLSPYPYHLILITLSLSPYPYHLILITLSLSPVLRIRIQDPGAFLYHSCPYFLTSRSFL